MAILKASCDCCGKIMESKFYKDYDGNYFCKKCFLKEKLIKEKKYYKEKMDWLKATHFKELRDKRKRIRMLESELNG